MNSPLKSLIFGTGLALGTLMAISEARAVSDGDMWPATPVQRHDKVAKLDKEALKGHTTIINFWATWCAACKVELKEMAKEFAPLARTGKVRFAFISLDKNPQDSIDWLEKNMGGAPLIMDNLFVDPKFALADELDLDSFPTTVIVDGAGKVVHVHKGFKEGEGSTQAIATKAKKLAAKVAE